MIDGTVVDCLGHNNHEMIELLTVANATRVASRTGPWTPKGQTLASFGKYLPDRLGGAVLKGLGVEAGWEALKGQGQWEGKADLPEWRHLVAAEVENESLWSLEEVTGPSEGPDSCCEATQKGSWEGQSQSWKLTSAVKGNKNCFYKYVSNRRRT